MVAETSSLTNTFLALALGLLPSIIWLVFFLQEDRLRPEPRGLIIKVFLIGALMIIPAFLFQKYLGPLMGIYDRSQYNFSLFLVFGGIEEILKFLAAYFVVRKKKEFDEPIDAMVYMITAALGFAAVEDISSALTGVNQVGEFSTLPAVTLRFIGATLLHALASGTVGYFWGKAMAKTKHHYLKLVLWGIALATLLHATFNYLILKTGPAGWAILFLIFVAFFIFQDFEKLKHKTIESLQ